MPNDVDLLDFNTWRAVHPEVNESIVSARNDHETRTVTMQWAGTSEGLAQLHDEADRRDITLIVRNARYGPAQLRSAAAAVFAAEADLARAGFELSSVTTDPDPEGLLIAGTDVHSPDGGDDQPLDDELVHAVHELIASLDGVSGAIAPEDVRVIPGRVNLL